MNDEDDEAWCCRTCGVSDCSLRYRSGKMPDCFTCQAYRNIVVNSRQKHAKRAAAGVERQVLFTAAEFAAWAGGNPRICTFCGIDDRSYWELDLRTSNGGRLEALGLDRLVNDLDYTLGNIAWCCYPCNRAKGNAFTAGDMAAIGAAIAAVWRRRAAGGEGGAAQGGATPAQTATKCRD